MPRRPLPIVPCPVYNPRDPTPRGEDGCEHCGHRVYDLAAMEEHEARRLLREPHQRLCVHARVRRDGSPIFRRARLAVGLSLGLAAVAACAPHQRELTLPGSLCEDLDGYEVPCETEMDAWLRTLPEATPTIDPDRKPIDETASSEPELPAGDDNGTAASPDEYDLLGFVDVSILEHDLEADREAETAERERLLELERRARAAHERGT